jgi:hypothetical protein
MSAKSSALARSSAVVGDESAHGARGCPMCGAEVEWVETEESFKHAGSTYWRTVISTLCDCFQERWGWGDYGTKKTVQAEALTIWNRRPLNEKLCDGAEKTP